jgi:hypothetical protein
MIILNECKIVNRFSWRSGKTTLPPSIVMEGGSDPGEALKLSNIMLQIAGGENLPQPFPELLKLPFQALRQPAPEKRKVLLDVRDLGFPRLQVHFHEGLHVR